MRNTEIPDNRASELISPPMSGAQRRIALALGRCTFLPGSWDKRFCRDMAGHAERSNLLPELKFTDRQIAHLLRLAHKYRRQLHAAILEEALDEMERQADRRVAEGNPALPDFSPARRQVLKAVGPTTKSPPPLPLFDL